MPEPPSPADEDLSVFDNIVFLLNNNGDEFEILEHGFVHRSEDAAKVRGTKLEEAAKALVLRAKNGAGEKKFFMCVVSGHKKMNMKKVKAMVDCKNVALAHPDDVFKVTGLRIGTVPPFPTMFNIDGYCDAAVLENKRVVFSAGSHYKSIRMKSVDWRGVAGVSVESFSQE